MSLKTWMNEFIPVDAELMKNTVEDALAHSILKYTGCLSENLIKHDVERRGRTIREILHPVKNKMHFAQSDCALCQRYQTSNDGLYYVDCFPCPVSRRGHSLACGLKNSLWYEFAGPKSREDVPLKIINFLKEQLRIEKEY